MPISVDGRNIMLNKFNVKLETSACNVYFFEGWSTYDHPVKPENPIDYISALKRGGYYRAWLCKGKTSDLFVQFEGVRINVKNKELISNDANIEFYESISAAGSRATHGIKILPEKTLNMDSFFIKIDRNFILIEQEIMMKYEYSYKDSGALEKAVITNYLGESNTLDF